jgi:glutamate-1-semialdehyde 2,1-aminomutase
MENITLIVQARCGSSRFPNKILQKIDQNFTLIEYLFKRLFGSKKINHFYLATTKKKEDDKLCDLFKNTRVKIFRGSENNVLSRYYNIAKKEKSKIIIRITGDCPFVDYKIIDKFIDKIQDRKDSNKFDYVSNTLENTYPDGFSVEVFNFNSIKLAYKNAYTKFDKEHVTPYIKRSKKINKFNFRLSKNLSHLRFSVDEIEDLIFIKKILKKLKNDSFDMKNILNILAKNKKLIKINKHIINNQGSNMSKGYKYWIRAKKLIPGGNMLLSKRPDIFLPNHWPTYYTKSKGCYIWDLDKKKYTDLSYMGVGTNILGYNHPEVNKSVLNAIKSGNLTTLNNPDEIFLAEKLIKMHQWSHMVKFARTGAEANSIAIRLSRAYTKKELVIFCGYHGWSDWYLANNLADKKVDQHLLKGIKIDGVSKSLKNSILAFKYNEIEELKKLIKKNNNKISALIMEVSRNYKPKNNFLDEIRKICNQNKIILIFDECTTGFRYNLGGLHLNYGVNPDLATFGKAIGNGYGITAILGKKKIMEKAKNTFISSTFWTEKLGVSAALKTIEIMENTKPWIKINKTGQFLKKKWKEISVKYKIGIKVIGLNAMPTFIFNNHHQILKTYFSQEMLKKNFLTSNTIYLSTTHTNKIINQYLIEFEKIFHKISKFNEQEIKSKNILEGPVSKSTFSRLN